MLIETELIARTVLLATVKPKLSTEVWAYRTLAATNPAYRSRLADALIRLERDTTDPEIRLSLSAQAVATARQIDPRTDAHATDLLIWALHAHQRNLHDAGRRDEALAARREILDRYPDRVHGARTCSVKDCYTGTLPIPVDDWITGLAGDAS